MLRTRQILMAAKFRLQNGHRRLILHKICHFEPFPKFEHSIKFSWGPRQAGGGGKCPPKVWNGNTIIDNKLCFSLFIVIQNEKVFLFSVK